MNSLATPSRKIGAEFLDVDGDIMRVQQVIGSDSFGIKLASSYREFPNNQAPAVALATLTAAGVTPQSEHYGLVDDPARSLRVAAHYLTTYAEQTQRAIHAAELTHRKDELYQELFDRAGASPANIDLAKSVPMIKTAIEMIIQLQDEATK